MCIKNKNDKTNNISNRIIVLQNMDESTLPKFLVGFCSIEGEPSSLPLES